MKIEDAKHIEELRDFYAPSSILPWEWKDSLSMEEQMRENMEVPSWIYLQH